MVILGIIGISALLGLLRGFVKDVLSMVAWAAAGWVGYRFNAQIADLFTSIDVPSARGLVAFLVLFMGTLLSIGLVNFILGRLISATGFGGTDRVLGVVSGGIRGVLAVWFIVFLLGVTTVPSDPWWKQSSFLPHFQALAVWSLQYFPPSIAQAVTFGKPPPGGGKGGGGGGAVLAGQGVDLLRGAPDAMAPLIGAGISGVAAAAQAANKQRGAARQPLPVGDAEAQAMDKPPGKGPNKGQNKLGGNDKPGAAGRKSPGGGAGGGDPAAEISPGDD
jgi:membrane protein required for colicin V production